MRPFSSTIICFCPIYQIILPAPALSSTPEILRPPIRSFSFDHDLESLDSVYFRLLYPTPATLATLYLSAPVGSHRLLSSARPLREHSQCSLPTTSVYVLPDIPFPYRFILTRLQVQTHDDDDHVAGQNSQPIPNSPPPSFRSRNSSRRNSVQHHDDDADRDIDDAFAAPSDDESDHDAPDGDRRRLVHSNDRDSPEPSAPVQPPRLGRRVTEINMFLPGGSRSNNTRTIGGGSSANDGVFANISAKPTRGEELDEKPPVCRPTSILPHLPHTDLIADI